MATLCTPGECERIMTIDDIVSLNSNVKRERISDDTNVNESGKELLNICKLNELFIFNGRIGASPECSYTCNTPQGSSVVDYIIGDGCILSYADTFHVNEASPLSDHSSITVHMNCLCRSNSDAKLDDWKTSVRYIWNNNNAEMYRNNICRDEVVLALNDIADQVHDTDSVNVINEITQQLQDVILTSAEHCRKSTVANKNKIVKPQRSKWYDTECEKQRQLYNRYRNIYSRCKCEAVKCQRDKEKVKYQRLCKQKCQLYSNEQTEIWCNTKRKDQKLYWQNLKVRKPTVGF